MSAESGWPASTEPLTGVLNADEIIRYDLIAITQVAATDEFTVEPKMSPNLESLFKLRIKFNPGGVSFSVARSLAANFVSRGEKIAEVKGTLIPFRNLSLV